MSDSVEDLQIRVMHQELAIEALNEAVARQDRLLQSLRTEIETLRERLQALKPSPLADDAPPDPPPHY